MFQLCVQLGHQHPSGPALPCRLVYLCHWPTLREVFPLTLIGVNPLGQGIYNDCVSLQNNKNIFFIYCKGHHILAGNISRENLGCGSLDDTFRVTKKELGISAVSKQTTKKSNTKVNRVL